MSTEHRFAELGECLSLIIDHRGKTPKKLGSDWVAGGVPTISANNVNDGRLVDKETIRYVTQDVYRRWMRNHDVRRGDCLLVSEGATLGQCMYWDEDQPIVLGQRLFCLRANPEVLYPRYLYCYMTSYSFQSEVVARSTGTSVPGLRQTEVLKLQLRLPPIEEQRIIGDLLYSLNKKIELNRRISDTLDAMSRALFKSWFVDFDPVCAKMEGRDPGLPMPLADLFPDSFEDSELGEIPKGWEVKTLGDLLELAYGKALKAEDRRDGNIPVYGSNGQVGWHDERLVAGPGIVVGRKGNPGIATWVPTDFFPIDTTFYVVPKLGCRSLEFLFHVLRTHDLASLGADSAVPGLNRNLAYMSSQVLPPAPLLAHFERHTSAFSQRVNHANDEIRTLVALRDTLLPKLISGELRVKVAEKFIPYDARRTSEVGT